MYRLVLPLPFGVRLVLRDHYNTDGDATNILKTLPDGFVVMPENEISPDEQTFEVPFLKIQRRKSETRRNNPVSDSTGNAP